MPPLSERSAEALVPAEATALVHVLDAQARWENHRAARPVTRTPTDLKARQKAFDAFQAAWRAYAAKHPETHLPELSHGTVDRVAVWCRALRAVFRRADDGDPAQVLVKVYRLVDRIAVRTGTEIVARTPAADLAAAVRELAVVIAWCDDLAPPGPPELRRKARAHDAA